jgi:hypothetical protein
MVSRLSKDAADAIANALRRETPPPADYRRQAIDVFDERDNDIECTGRVSGRANGHDDLSPLQFRAFISGAWGEP